MLDGNDDVTREGAVGQTTTKLWHTIVRFGRRG
jgi:hypothetical protein